MFSELRKSPMSRFYRNSVDRRDFMSIRSGQTVKKLQRLDFFKELQRKTIFKPSF